MITDTILNILFYLPLLLLKALPRINFSLPDDVFNGFSDFLSNVGYVVPMKALLPILASSLAISTFKISWALIIRIKSFIPTMGA
ncbi:MAG: hypothetical protein K2N49_00175 [Ruminococcus sp.]|nr:hypothetical protein [Ruminococcus sp.]MDE5763526.1 hypothetical protein [Ruminococcus sp.]MDE7225275.1 hypothetical protein [Ruminococcus sp.]